MSRHIPQGLLITFEGCEGSGKTTLMNRLRHHLETKGQAVVVTREPGGSPLGEAIRSLLLHKNSISISPMAELLLFLAARAQNLQELIRPALAEGKIVLCDRFNDSTLAYQGAARNMDPAEIQHLCDLVCEKTTPVLTLLLDVDTQIGFERVKAARNSSDRMEEESFAFHEKVRQAFLSLARKHPERIIVIDANLAPEQVFAQAVKALDRVLT